MSPNQWTPHAGRTAEAGSLTIRLSKDERIQLNTRAEAAGVGVSEYIRRQLGLLPEQHDALGRRAKKQRKAKVVKK